MQNESEKEVPIASDGLAGEAAGLLQTIPDVQIARSPIYAPLLVRGSAQLENVFANYNTRKKSKWRKHRKSKKIVLSSAFEQRIPAN